MFLACRSRMLTCAVLLAAAAALVACGGAKEPAAEKGTLEVRVTDQLDRRITSVLVTVTGVEVRHAGSGEWRTAVEGPVSFDLIALSGVEAVLGSARLEAGGYTQVRLSVDHVEVTRSGKTEDAEVLGDPPELAGTFMLEPGETTVITLDFKVEDSLLEKGGSGLFRPLLVFKPSVELLIGEPGEPGKPTVPLTGEPAK